MSQYTLTGALFVPGVLEGEVPVFGVVLLPGDKESVPVLWFTSQKQLVS